MSRRREIGKRSESDPEDSMAAPTASWLRLRLFISLLVFDSVSSLLLLTPLIPRLKASEDLSTDHYTLHGSLWDLAFLAVPRILSASLAILLSYHRNQPITQSPFELYHKNGDRKSKAELEAEALEEPWLPKFRRYVSRYSFPPEFFVLVTGIVLAAKCLARLNVEIGILDESAPRHPVFWAAIALTALCSCLESLYVDSIENIANECGRVRRRELVERGRPGTWMERISHNLAQPLLTRSSEDEVEDEEQGNGEIKSESPKNDRVRSDIEADASYKASWTELLTVCAEDKLLIATAFVFLLAASVANIYVPRFTGNVLDALVAHASDDDKPSDDDGSIVNIPGFVSNIEKLVLVSILGGIFGGIRGAIFTVVGARVNVRLRIRLMDSILSQDIAFFDMTRTGDLTSRLSSDTTLVGSAITMNVNVFLRSVVQAIGVLVFMFLISWQLTLLAFVTIPAVSVLSKWYGRYIRRLTKLQQKKLAEGNSVSESAISAMSTVRAFGAETVELAEFEKCMGNYLDLNTRAAVATLGYSTCVGALPELVKALVLFYGGLLVQSTGSNHISGGQLISFVLYLSSLSNAFSSLSGIFSSLSRATGAADKVFELMHREPRLTPPSSSDSAQSSEMRQSGLLGTVASLTLEQRTKGVHPETCEGLVTLKNVEMRYPARPQRVVLDNLDMTVPAGSIVALVGSSGSGKSTVISLIQHLYEPTSGEISIDGTKVHDLSPEWLCRNVSVVSQEPTLFARSVRRNIIYGLEGTPYEPSQEEIEEAAQLANASGFIERLPFGYETDIGERGVQLSGGQRQRIGIARALVRKPRILLLDEATSALDAESEALVQEAIDGMISGQRSLDGDPSRSMTVIIVAHRLSTVRNADIIFVAEDGKIVEKGTHDALIAKPDGVYSALVSRQITAQKRLGQNGSQVSLAGYPKSL